MTMNIMRIQNQDIVTDDIFQIVIEHFPDIVHSVDSEGNIVFTNKMAETLLGYSREELLSMNIREIYADEVLQELEQGFKNLKKEGEKTVESVLKDRNGNRIPVEIRSFSIYDNDGSFIRTFSILRDIREVKDLQQSLIHAARLAAIGEMALGIVHDVNNPLNVISMCSEIMDKSLKLLHPQTGTPMGDLLGRTQDIMRATESINKLVTHLRNFSRGVAESREVIDLHQSIGDAIFLVGSKIKKERVIVRSEVESEEYFTRGRANQLEQVFANLFSNACDAMAGSEERVISIGIEPCVRDSAYYWKCSVHDTGCGIPKELQQDVFGSFFTTKSEGEGTGLGLSIVRGIVKDHGGDIEVMSQPGRGTTFSVYFLQQDLNDETLNRPYLLDAS